MFGYLKLNLLEVSSNEMFLMKTFRFVDVHIFRKEYAKSSLEKLRSMNKTLKGSNTTLYQLCKNFLKMSNVL